MVNAMIKTINRALNVSIAYVTTMILMSIFPEILHQLVYIIGLTVIGAIIYLVLLKVEKEISHNGIRKLRT